MVTAEVALALIIAVLALIVAVLSLMLAIHRKGWMDGYDTGIGDAPRMSRTLEALRILSDADRRPGIEIGGRDK